MHSPGLGVGRLLAVAAVGVVAAGHVSAAGVALQASRVLLDGGRRRHVVVGAVRVGQQVAVAVVVAAAHVAGHVAVAPRGGVAGRALLRGRG